MSKIRDNFSPSEVLFAVDKKKSAELAAKDYGKYMTPRCKDLTAVIFTLKDSWNNGLGGLDDWTPLCEQDWVAGAWENIEGMVVFGMDEEAIVAYLKERGYQQDPAFDAKVKEISEYE